MRAQAQLEVNFCYLEHNYQLIHKLAPESMILPMVKANAYGHGLVSVSQFLGEELKVPVLGVATLGEALALVQEYPDYAGKIWVFSETNLQDSRFQRSYLNNPILPVIHRLEDLRLLISDSSFKFLPLILKMNTGMNRLGFIKSEWQEVAQLLKKSGRPITHLMTHFAVSYYPLKDGDRNHLQMEEFKEARSFFESEGIKVESTSVANSGAIEQTFGVSETYVRPGLMLYGPGSVYMGKEKTPLWKGKLVSKLTCEVLKIFSVRKGDPVGYGTNVAPENGVILVLPLGYGDGILTFMSGVELKVKGHRAKVFGRVNMDMTFLFLPLEALKDFREGEWISLWEEDPLRLVEISDQMQTHPYQVLCAISSRVPRYYCVE